MIKVDAGVEPQTFQYRYQNFKLGVPCPSPESAGAAINHASAGLSGGNRVGHRHAQIIVGVENKRHIHLPSHRGDAFGHILRQQVAGRIHDADGLRTVLHQQLSLIG
ncbi:hypothetical protein D3C80_472760 [compost metagenome]